MLKNEYNALREKYHSKEIPCEICGSNDLDIIQYRGRIREAGVYGPVPVAVCKNCGFTFQNPRFEDSFYEDYYKHLYREVAFGSAVPSREYIETQVKRGSNVLDYLSRFVSTPGVMLDHGCASGATMIPFVEAGWKAVGVDPHEPSVDVGVNHLGQDIRVGGGESLCFESSYFDVVVSLGSLEHVYEFARSMSELRRVLKDNGLVFIRWRSNHLWGSPYEYYNHNHYRFFTPVTWRLALESYGFAVVETTFKEIEGNTGAAYTIARKLSGGIAKVQDLVADGVREGADKVIANLNAYKRDFSMRCRDFINFVDSVHRDPLAVKQGVESGFVNYRLLLGDPNWTVPRAILEAERYEAEFLNDPLVNHQS